MSLKGTKTITTFIEWETFKSLIAKMERDKEYKFCLLISIGVFTALRISDLLTLKYSDILDKEILTITEHKTNKIRSIKLNADLLALFNRIYPQLNVKDPNQLIFLNRFGTKAIDKSYVNVKLKEIFCTYKINLNGNISSHTFRKTLGRRIMQQNDYSNQFLILLSELFGHSSVGITRKYLGIQEKEIHSLYDCVSL
ncbi:MAG: tyrosine-type recombinase/integrase [Candidatus Methylacidiphilales bacterium]